jgi:hypothetical protein
MPDDSLPGGTDSDRGIDLVRLTAAIVVCWTATLTVNN